MGVRRCWLGARARARAPICLSRVSAFFLAQHLSINASIMTLVLIALDRYRGIMHPLKGPYAKVKAKASIAAIWVVGAAGAVPNLLAFHVSHSR